MTDELVHITDRSNLASIRANGLNINHPRQRHPFPEAIENNLGISPIYVARTGAYGGQRIQELKGANGVGLNVDTRGLSLHADIPGLNDFGVEFIASKDGGEMHLKSPMARDLFHDVANNGVVSRAALDDPESTFTRRAIEVSGTAAIHQSVDANRIDFPVSSVRERARQAFDTFLGRRDQTGSVLSDEEFEHDNPKPTDTYPEAGYYPYTVSLREQDMIRNGRGDELIATFMNVHGLDADQATEVIDGILALDLPEHQPSRPAARAFDTAAIGPEMEGKRGTASEMVRPGDRSDDKTIAMETQMTRDQNAALQSGNGPTTGAPTRDQMRNEVTSWMSEVSDRMVWLSPADQAELKPAITRIATDALKLLGDERGAELTGQPPKTELYRTAVREGEVRQGAEATPISREHRDTLIKTLASEAGNIGIPAEDLHNRLSRGAANAQEERDWVRADVASVAKARGMDFDDPADRSQAARLVDRFYDKAASFIAEARGVEVEAPGERLRQTLTAMTKIEAEHGKVAFDNDASARAFTEDMKSRYGETIMQDLAQGKTDRLASDFADPGERRQIARAVIAIGAAHEEPGVSRSETDRERDTQADPKEAAILQGVQAEVKRLRAEGYSRAYISEHSADIEGAVVARIEKHAHAKDRDQDRER
ncbi:MAG: hypothetical protein WBB85_12940 [Albidovulum sp.]|uniref:hypothetical protein n=1 Tax=Albidovulum sp. TaxID=1872424 RepID=UPI003C950FFB